MGVYDITKTGLIVMWTRMHLFFKSNQLLLSTVIIVLLYTVQYSKIPLTDVNIKASLYS